IKASSKTTREPLPVVPDYQDALGRSELVLPSPRCLDGGSALVANKECTYGVILRRGDKGKGVLVLLGDDRLFSNAALAAGDNGAFIVSLLNGVRTPGTVQIVDEMTGQSSPSPFASLSRA